MQSLELLCWVWQLQRLLSLMLLHTMCLIKLKVVESYRNPAHLRSQSAKICYIICHPVLN
jgi:hypothetical protein